MTLFSITDEIEHSPQGIRQVPMGKVACAVIALTERALQHERAKRALDWIRSNRNDLTFGTPGKLLRIAEQDSVSLAEFEDQGRRGNSLMLHEADFGQVWWLDPEDRYVTIHSFAFIHEAGGGVSYEIRFMKEPHQE